MERITVSSGSKWEDIAGYSRAIRVGNVIKVAGTVAVDEQGKIIGPNDIVAQTEFIFEKIDKALLAADSSLKDVVQTRMFIADISGWEKVALAHGKIFKDIRPVTTMVEAKLIQPEFLIEIEAEAISSS